MNAILVGKLTVVMCAWGDLKTFRIRLFRVD